MPPLDTDCQTVRPIARQEGRGDGICKLCCISSIAYPNARVLSIDCIQAEFEPAILHRGRLQMADWAAVLADTQCLLTRVGTLHLMTEGPLTNRLQGFVAKAVGFS